MIGITFSVGRWATAPLLLIIAMTACSHGTRKTAPPSPQSDARAEGENAAIAKARADSARYPYTAADIHFMSAMIGHHAQAIAIAEWAPTHDANPSIRLLAERIINGQQDEIAIMQRWLRVRRQPVPDARTIGMKMMMNGVEHAMSMPGMLTEDQMKELEKARGKEFDRLFLSMMIQHHRGAVSMVNELFSSYGAGLDDTVFKFASDVNVDQSTEIERMRKMLAALTLGIQLQ